MIEMMQLVAIDTQTMNYISLFQLLQIKSKEETDHIHSIYIRMTQTVS